MRTISSPRARSDGLYKMAYFKCPGCPVTHTPKYVPLDNCMLKLPPSESEQEEEDEDYVPENETQEEIQPNVIEQRNTTTSRSSPPLSQAVLLPESQPVPQPQVTVPATTVAPQRQTSSRVDAQSLPSLEDICTTHVPLVMHIPSRIRPEVANALSRTVWEAAKAPIGSQEATDAFTRILLFPAAILTNPKPASIRLTPAGTGSHTDTFRERLRLWERKQYATLWDLALPSSTARPAHTPSPQEQERSNAKRSIRLAKEGAYGKAANALTSTGIAAPSEHVSQDLLNKHPQQVPETDTIQYTATTPAAADWTKVTAEEVIKSVKKFPAASAAGGSGLRPNHLDELLKVPNTNEDVGLIGGITAVVNILAQGKGPATIAPWIAGAPLTALNKPEGGGVRPIAVGETLRRLVSGCLMARESESAKEFFQPLQLGIATSGGAEALVHAARKLHQSHGQDSSYALLQVDLRNAFNLVSRPAFFNSICTSFPNLVPWVKYCYTGDHANLWCGEDIFKSVTGVQQGDPLSPLLFGAALQGLLKKLRDLLQGEAADPELAGLLLQLFYLDDGVLVAKHELLVRALDFFASTEVKGYGFHLRMDKCKIWWSTPPTPEVQQRYSPQVKQNYGPGTHVLKAPIGTARFVENDFVNHVESLRPLLEAVVKLEDLQVALSLLRTCFGICRLTYLLRAIPSAQTQKGAKAFDVMIEDFVRKLLGGVLDHTIFKELQLPLSSKKPSLGIGLSSAVSSSPPAFLASLSLTRPLCRDVLPRSANAALSADPAAVQAYEMWSSMCSDETRMPMRRLDVDRGPIQRTLTACVTEAIQERLPPGELRTRAFRAQLSMPRSKQWLKCQPAPGLRTYIPDRDYRVWLQYFCQIPINEPDTVCPRRGCKVVLDIYGDHSLLCPSGSERIWRHNQQVRLVAADLSRAARQPILESRVPGEHNERPDITCHGSRGGTDLLDVTFVHPLTRSRLQGVTSNPKGPLDVAVADKERRYRPLLEAQGSEFHLVPLPISTLGGWHPEAHEYMQSLADAIASRAMVSRAFSRGALFNRHAALLVRNNAKCLLGDVSVRI